MPRLRWGPSAFVVACLALFVALGGTGYALTQPQESTTSDGAAVARALPAWRNIRLLNGWQNGGWNSYQLSYYKDSGRVVHLRGSAATAGDPSLPAFVMPPGARPSHTLWLSVYAVNGQSGGLQIDPDGTAWLFDHYDDTLVSSYASVDGVSFRVP